jgi:hypothetical protein
MSPFTRNAKTVVRLIAAGFLLVGALNLAAYGFKCHHENTDINIWQSLGKSIPLVIGVAILIKSSALADRIEEWLDE